MECAIAQQMQVVRDVCRAAPELAPHLGTKKEDIQEVNLVRQIAVEPVGEKQESCHKPTDTQINAAFCCCLWKPSITMRLGKPRPTETHAEIARYSRNCLLLPWA